MSEFRNLVGQQFGALIVVDRAENSKAGKTRWRCLCDCGKYVVVRGDALTSGNTKSCGHCKWPADLAGLHFGELFVVSRVGNDLHGKILWKCKCSCGKEKIIAGNDLKSGHTRSCGHLRDGHPKHGQYQSRLYRIWRNMVDRCYREKIWRTNTMEAGA